MRLALVCLAGFGILLGAQEGVAGPLPPDLSFAPRFTGKFDAYGFGVDLPGMKARTGPIGRGCPISKTRGARLKVQQQADPNDPSVPSLGFFSVFPDANQKRQPVQIMTLIDVWKLDTAGASAAVELDSPFVPIGMTPPFFASLVVTRQMDGQLVVYVATQAGNVGTPIYLPEDTPAVVGRMDYDGGLLDVDAAACDAPLLTNLVTDHALAFGGSAGLGAGIVGWKGDEAGFGLAVNGDLFDATKRDILEDLQAVIDLEVAALADLGNGMAAEARTKTEQARALLEDQGPPIPATDPQEYEPDLIEKVGALPESDAREDALKRLGKAAERDAKARDQLDKGTPKSLKDAEKQLSKARDEKVRAKAILETGVTAEGKGKL
jgi:hypothetical protein